MAPEYKFLVGQQVRALRQVSFKSGKTVEPGDIGVVTKIPGTTKTSVAQVRVKSCLFSAEPGDIEPVVSTPTQPSRHDSYPAMEATLTQPRAASEPSVHTVNEQEREHISVVETEVIRSGKTAPVRYVQYADFIGHWGDELQKSRVFRLEKQLKSAAGRLSEEAAAKFEEVAWLQAELEKWHAEAEERGKMVEKLQFALREKDMEIDHLKKLLEAREGELAWLREELARKTKEANALAAEVARLEGLLRSKLEEIARLESEAVRKGGDDADRIRELERKLDEARLARQALDDQLYRKMEELAKAEQALKMAEERIRALEAALEREKAERAREVDALQKMILELQRQLARLRGVGGTGSVDVACQVRTSLADLYEQAQQIIADLKKQLAEKEALIAQLQQRLADAANARGDQIDALKAALAERDARIAELEAERGANWRKHAGPDPRDKRIADLEAELDRLRKALDAMPKRAEVSQDSEWEAKDLARRLREAERQLKEAERRNWELERLRDLLDAKLGRAAATVVEQQNEIVKLHAALAEADETAMREVAKREQLEALLDELRAALPAAHEASVLELLEPLRAALLSQHNSTSSSRTSPLRMRSTPHTSLVPIPSAPTPITAEPKRISPPRDKRVLPVQYPAEHPLPYRDRRNLPTSDELARLGSSLAGLPGT